MIKQSLLILVEFDLSRGGWFMEGFSQPGVSRVRQGFSTQI